MMLALFEQLRRRWQGGDGDRPNDAHAFAGKWPDTAQIMARLITEARDPGGARVQQSAIDTDLQF
jgi:hypothetical protein